MCKILWSYCPSLNRSQEIPREAVGGIPPPTASHEISVSTVFCYNFRPEVDNDVIVFSVAVDNVGMDVCIKFGDSRSNRFDILKQLISCQTNENE